MHLQLFYPNCLLLVYKSIQSFFSGFNFFVISRTQKIIWFIPVVNFITMFMWINTCMRMRTTMGDYLKTLLGMFFWMIVMTIPRIVLSVALDNNILDTVLAFITVPAYFYVLSFLAIRAQERIIQKNASSEKQ